MKPLAWTACLAAALMLGACRSEAPSGTPRQALATSGPRHGPWLGGPEPVSGKLRSGLVTWWRLTPARPEPGLPFELTVRVEDVTQVGATLAIGTGDGAQLVDAADAGPWSLRAGSPSVVSVRLTAPSGASHVHLMLHQGDRDAVRSILLPLPGRNPAETAQQRHDYATDAGGEAIVRMPADKAP